MKDKYAKKSNVNTTKPSTEKFTPELSRTNITKKITKTSSDLILEQRKAKLDKKLATKAI